MSLKAMNVGEQLIKEGIAIRDDSFEFTMVQEKNFHYGEESLAIKLNSTAYRCL